MGRVIADGQPFPVEGKIPATFTYKAVRIEFQIERVDGEKEEWFAIDVTADGQRVAIGTFDRIGRGKMFTSGIGWWRTSRGSCYVGFEDIREEMRILREKDAAPLKEEPRQADPSL